MIILSAGHIDEYLISLLTFACHEKGPTVALFSFLERHCIDPLTLSKGQVSMFLYLKSLALYFTL